MSEIIDAWQLTFTVSGENRAKKILAKDFGSACMLSRLYLESYFRGVKDIRITGVHWMPRVENNHDQLLGPHDQPPLATA